MKICELNIQNGIDRDKIVSILANANYKVSIDIRRKGYYDFEGIEYFVIVESKETNEGGDSE